MISYVAKKWAVRIDWSIVEKCFGNECTCKLKRIYPYVVIRDDGSAFNEVKLRKINKYIFIDFFNLYIMYDINCVDFWI